MIQANRFLGDGSPPPETDASTALDRARSQFAVAAAVCEVALKTWARLWEQIKPGVTPSGMVLPAMQQGFKPACGWAEFLEAFWTLKRDVEYACRFCQEASRQAGH